MLTPEQKAEIGHLLDRELSKLREEIAWRLRAGETPAAVFHEMPSRMADNLAFVSKLLLGTAYHWMKERTLAERFFAEDVGKNAAFYEHDIESRLREAFVFVAPEVDPKAWRRRLLVKEASLVGGCGVLGVAAAGAAGSWVPMGCAAILIVAVVVACEAKPGLLATKRDVERCLDRHLAQVRQTFMAWIDAIEAFYDKQVETLKNKRG